MSSRSLAAAAAASVLALTACGSGTTTSSSTTSSTTRQTLTVLAAASLTEAFGRLTTAYEKAHPGTTIVVSYEASSTIVQQLNHDAPADVVALADEASKDKLTGADAKTRTWTAFATNKLEIATPKDNPAHVTSLAGLATADTVLCAPQVPCGRAADQALARAGTEAHVVSYEKDVKATLAKVITGDADAALVYATDVSAAGDTVTGVPIPASANVTTTLPLTAWGTSVAAKDLADYLTGPTGRQVLQSEGFGAPA